MRQNKIIFVIIFCLLFAVGATIAQTRNKVSQTVRTITVITEPKAIVWIDGVRRGETDENGKLLAKPVMNGIRKLRVRADGFKELEKNLLASQKGDLKITLVKTNDQAELAYQEAERATLEDKNRAVDLYEKAIRLRPAYLEALVSLARVLGDLGSNEEALKAIVKARKIRPAYAEASAVEGRIYKDMGEYDKAINSFERAIREGKGFQPEAHTGLALLFNDEAESARSENDTEDEIYYYGEAAKSFEIAIEQLSSTEPVVYLFLGKIYENIGKKQKAIAVYERFLRDMPENEEATAVESFIVQLRKAEIIK